jgi:DNA-binding SARP family transcriptional activator/tetratricopeptide (TPR) repeat protein/DNA-binding transcriptional ArsR family regulator
VHGQFRLLGPLKVIHDGRRVETGRRRERCLLGVLLLQAGKPVSVNRLMSLLWDDEPPATARASLHSHVARLRSRVDPGDAAVLGLRLRNADGGYVADIDRELVDAHRFSTLVSRARAELVPDHRVELLQQSLSMWRGPVLAGDASERLRDRVAARITEERIAATELLFEAELTRGRHADLVGELTRVAAEFPHHERLTGQLMIALYRCGRHVDALDLYRQFRDRLARALGADPTPELQRLHAAILRHDAELVGEALTVHQTTRAMVVVARPASATDERTGGHWGADSRAAALPRPAQLPANVSGFTGRAGDLSRLNNVLAGDGDDARLAVIVGAPGVGKTALAVHWAHQIAHHFPDGHLFINLRGFDPSGSPTSPAEAVRTLLDSLGVPAQHVPVGVQAQIGLYRSMLAERRLLIVLDNARDGEQVRPLLPGSDRCLTLVTSRNHLAGLIASQAARPLALGPLTQVEAREMLARRLGRRRAACEPDALDDIVISCARLPLALAVLAARAALHPGFPLATLADELRDVRDRLSALADGGLATDVRTVFSWSYRTCTVEAARLFRLIGLCPGHDLSAATAASLAGIAQSTVRPLLAELSRANLVTEHIPGRWACHDLLRVYSAELAHAVDTDTRGEAARHRVLDHLLHTSYAADRLLQPHRDPITLAAPQPGVMPQRLADRSEALRWFGTERCAVLAAIELAADTGFATHTWQLAWNLTTFLHVQGRWKDYIATQRIALAATRRLADRAAQAHTHRLLGVALAEVGQHDDAYRQFRAALDLFGDLGDQLGRAHTHLRISVLFDHEGRHRDALDHSRQAFDLFRIANHLVGQARALNSLGWDHCALGQYENALACCKESLTLNAETGDQSADAGTWDTLGQVHRQLGHHRQAISCYRNSSDMFHQLGDRYHEADSLIHIGDIHLDAEEADAARDAWTKAVTILDELDHPEAARVRARLHTSTATSRDGSTAS